MFFQNQVRGFIGAVAGRSALDKIFLVKVKPFMPKKEPGKKYTRGEIEKGYIEFLETDDPFATELKKVFSRECAQHFCLMLRNEVRSRSFIGTLVILGLNNKQLARKIRKLYGRLSTLDHALFNILRSIYTIEEFMEFICNIPAVLSSADMKTVRKFTEVYFRTESDEESDNDEESDSDED